MSAGSRRDFMQTAGAAGLTFVSASGRDLADDKDLLQIDAPVNRGNSGGPTFDLSGHVVGVNTMILSPTGGSIGLAFAIPASRAEHVVAQLKAKVSAWAAALRSLGVQKNDVVAGILPNGIEVKIGL